MIKIIMMIEKITTRTSVVVVMIMIDEDKIEDENED